MTGSKVKYKDFIESIHFRFVDENTDVWKYILSSLRTLDRIGVSFEFVNLRVADEEQYLKSRIRKIFTIRKKSTLAIGILINKIVSEMKNDEVFLNIGVWKGFSLFAGMVGNGDKTCIGVDNFSQFGSPREEFIHHFQNLKKTNHHFFEVSYQEYFKDIHKEKIGFYIYDGHHSYENQFNNLVIAERFFSDDCIIMIDDINFPQVRKATMDFIANSTNTYEIIADKRTPRDRHLTFWNGIILIQKTG